LIVKNTDLYGPCTTNEDIVSNMCSEDKKNDGDQIKNTNKDQELERKLSQVEMESSRPGVRK